MTTYNLTPNESVTVVERRDDALVVEAEYAPSRGAPPVHLHPAQDEHFEVLSGTIRAAIRGERHALDVGETLDIPRGTPHRMWNGGSAPAKVRWTTTPPGRTEDWFAVVDRLNGQRTAGGRRRLDLLGFAAALPGYRDTFVLTGPPRFALLVMWPIARLLRRDRG